MIETSLTPVNENGGGAPAGANADADYGRREEEVYFLAGGADYWPWRLAKKAGTNFWYRHTLEEVKIEVVEKKSVKGETKEVKKKQTWRRLYHWYPNHAWDSDGKGSLERLFKVNEKK